jgi:hypothetical protein
MGCLQEFRSSKHISSLDFKYEIPMKGVLFETVARRVGAACGILAAGGADGDSLVKAVQDRRARPKQRPRSEFICRKLNQNEKFCGFEA